MKLPSMSVRVKLLSVVGLMSVVSAGVGLLGWNQMASIEGRLEYIVEHASPRKVIAGEIQTRLVEFERAERDFILAGSDEERATRLSYMEAKEPQIRELLTALRAETSGEDLAKVDAFEQKFNAYVSLNQQVVDLANRDSDGKAFALSTSESQKKFDALAAALDALTVELHGRMQTIADDLRANPAQASGQTLEGFFTLSETAMLADDLQKIARDMFRMEKNMILSNTTEEKDLFYGTLAESRELFRKDLEQLASLTSGSDAALVETAAQQFEAWNAVSSRVVDLSREGTTEQARHLAKTESRDKGHEAEKVLGELIASASKKMDDYAAQAKSVYQQASLFMGIATVLGIAIGVGLALYIIKQIVGGLAKVSNRMQAIADGKLNLPALDVKSQDELGKLATVANDMQHGLNKLVTEVIENATQVAAASTEVSATSEQLARSVDQQRDQLSQVSAAVEELSTSISEVSTRSQDVSARSSQAGRDATEGGRVVGDTVDQINAIAQHIEATGRSVSELSVKAEQIGQILTVINDIADQTNLLALNAAIEAARAGEHGRGFAVVADEVRKLAERTTEATQEVANSITEIQTGTRQATDGMVSSQEKLAGGVELAQSAGKSLEQIVRGSQEVATSVDSIAAAVEQQSAATGEIASSIERTNASTSEASEAAGEASAAAGQLSANAERLRSIVARFDV